MGQEARFGPKSGLNLWARSALDLWAGSALHLWAKSALGLQFLFAKRILLRGGRAWA